MCVCTYVRACVRLGERKISVLTDGESVQVARSKASATRHVIRSGGKKRRTIWRMTRDLEKLEWRLEGKNPKNRMTRRASSRRLIKVSKKMYPNFRINLLEFALAKLNGPLLRRTFQLVLVNRKVWE